MCAKDYSGPGNRDSGGSSLDHPAIFYGGTQPIGCSTTAASHQSSTPDSSNLGRSSSSSRTTEAHGMQVIRRSLCESDIPTDIINTIMHSWRDGTHKQYNTYINRWLQFCVQETCDPLRPTVKCVLMFLHSLYTKGMSYSSLNTARSAISNLGLTPEASQSYVPIGRHLLVCRYLKGVFNELKPVPKYHATWLVDPVLDYLSTLWPLDRLSLKEVTLKLVMLIALTTGQRCQTLTFLDISSEYMHKMENSYRFVLTEHVKQNRPGNVFGHLCLYKYAVRELCVYETLDYYLDITEKLRTSPKLLVSFIKPFGAVTASTVGRWIKTLLGQAGVDTTQFSAHSTRSASTSKAAASVPVELILATAGWKEESTFRRFYNRPVAVTDQMSVAVLKR